MAFQLCWEAILAKTGSVCIACDKPAVKASMCMAHYHRFRRHGHFDQTRPEDWGQKSKHPLWERWKAMGRQGGRVAAWDDFWTFVAAVGERPEEFARLHRLDDDMPWGPENFVWRARMAPAQSDRTGAGREAYNAYMREWRRQNHGRTRDHEMRRRRGMDIAQYDALLEAQGGGCAICGLADPNFRLAIDHDHMTGQNRGLLCSKHNRALGLFADRPDLLRKAATYLELHFAKQATKKDEAA